MATHSDNLIQFRSSPPTPAQLAPPPGAGPARPTNQLRRIERPDLAPFLSPYLMHGYREDAATLTSCVIGERMITGLVDIDSHFQTGDGFHLSVPVATIWIAQLAIIYGCVDAGLEEKSGEAYLREFAIECRKPVRKLGGIEFSLQLDARRKVHDRILYKGRFTVEQDHFVGRASFILPIT